MNSRNRYFIFDLDGVLVDTRDAVCQAYKQAGVDMPDDAWGKPWTDWGPDYCKQNDLDPDIVHRLKNHWYSREAQNLVRGLPPLWVAHELYEDDRDVRILTAASYVAYRATCHLTQPIPLLGSICPDRAKFEILKTLNATGVYVDDRPIDVPHGWELVQYDDGMTREELKCTLLS